MSHRRGPLTASQQQDAAWGYGRKTKWDAIFSSPALMSWLTTLKSLKLSLKSTQEVRGKGSHDFDHDFDKILDLLVQNRSSLVSKLTLGKLGTLGDCGSALLESARESVKRNRHSVEDSAVNKREVPR